MPDPGQDLDGAAPERPPPVAEVERHRLRELIAHADHRIERGARVLEDHGDLLAPDAGERAFVEAEQILAAKAHRAAHPSRRADQAEHRFRRQRLAGARLADEPHDLAAADGEADLVDGAQGPVLGKELDDQVADLQDRLGHHRVRGGPDDRIAVVRAPAPPAQSRFWGRLGGGRRGPLRHRFIGGAAGPACRAGRRRGGSAPRSSP